jgi:hypothetical protein
MSSCVIFAPSVPQSSTVRLVFAALSAAVLAWTLRVVTLADDHMIGYLNDDAFYYLIPAHSFAHGAGWTFDGVTRTSGFQLLYGYVAALAALGAGYTRALPIVMTISSAIALLIGVRLVLGRSSAMYGSGIAAAAMGLTLASPRAFLQITAGLEWGWAVMMTGLLVWSLARATPSQSTAAMAAFLAVLTRVDLSFFVAIYVCMMAWSSWQSKAGSARKALSLILVCGIASGTALAVTAANSWLITGQWIPNSVAMKEFWSHSNAFLPAISWNMIVSCTGPGAVLTWVRQAAGLRSAIVIAFFFVIAIAVCINEWNKGFERRALAIASVLTLAAYSVAYGRTVNLVADHYSAPIIMPMALLMCGVFTLAQRYWPVAAGALTVGVVVAGVTGNWDGFPAHRVIARHAGTLFAKLPHDARVAGWNVGIAGWRTQKRVMNLDGLANADVVQSIQSGTLVCYLEDNRIGYIMDFGFMFAGQVDTAFSDNEGARRQMLIERYGYDPQALYRCVAIKDTAPDDTVPTSRYRIFAVDRGCVAALCAARRGAKLPTSRPGN